MSGHLSQRTSSSEHHSSRAISDLWAKKFLQGGMPKLLLNAVESERKESSRLVTTEKVTPDSVLLHSVSLQTRRQKGRSLLWYAGLMVPPATANGEVQLPVGDDESLVGDLADDKYWVPDWRWRDNRLSIRGSGALERLATLVKGPGAVYQISYRLYCTFATLSLFLCFAGLMTVVTLTASVTPIVSNVTVIRTASHRKVICEIGTIASALFSGAIVAIFVAHLIRALTVHSFATVKRVAPRSGSIIDKSTGSVGSRGEAVGPIDHLLGGEDQQQQQMVVNNVEHEKY